MLEEMTILDRVAHQSLLSVCRKLGALASDSRLRSCQAFTCGPVNQEVVLNGKGCRIPFCQDIYWGCESKIEAGTVERIRRNSNNQSEAGRIFSSVSRSMPSNHCPISGMTDSRCYDVEPGEGGKMVVL